MTLKSGISNSLPRRNGKMVLRRAAGAGRRISQGPNIPKVLGFIPMNDTTVHPFMYVQVSALFEVKHHLLASVPAAFDVPLSTSVPAVKHHL